MSADVISLKTGVKEAQPVQNYQAYRGDPFGKALGAIKVLTEFSYEDAMAAIAHWYAISLITRTERDSLLQFYEVMP